MRTIGQRYELRGELAAGGMATVLLARQLGAGGFARIVAVKRLHERYAREPDFVAMFLDEARLVARIRHPNVVQTLDVVAEKNSDGGQELFIVMEYVHGESLLRLLQLARKKDEPIPLKIASAIMVGALHGLHDAHEARSESGQALGIVHRDISPHNILVGIDGVARVLDFGVAKASERITSTEEGKVKGKLSYMAPEQLSNEELDRRTDIYAVGIVLWEILAGQKLFVASNEGALIKMVLESPVEPPSRRNGNVPNALDRVIMRSLARDPSERFDTALEFANALNAAIPPASTAEVGAWVREIAASTLDEKTRAISAIEATMSSKNAEQAHASVKLSVSPKKSKTELVPPELAKTSVAPPRDLTKTAPLPKDFVAPVVPSIPPRINKTQLLVPESTGNTGTNVTAAVSKPPVSVTPSGAPKSEKKSGAPWLGIVVGLVAVGAIATVGVKFLKKDDGTPPVVASAAPSASASAAPVAGQCPGEMVSIPGGTFTMGNEDRLDEKPVHKVTLPAFCMDRLEVSVNDYKACSDKAACLRAGQENVSPDITPKEKKFWDPLCNAGDPLRGNHPVNCVDWKMANQYCEEVGKRLPTEAEWEYVARGGDTRPFPWGSDSPDSKRLNGCGTECTGWQKKMGIPPTGVLYSEDDGFPATAPVGSFPNGRSLWGVEDLAGNVGEWTSDFMAPYERADVTDPKGPEAGKERVVRGGTFTTSKRELLRPTYRMAVLPVTRHYMIGFRCAKAPKI